MQKIVAKFTMSSTCAAFDTWIENVTEQIVSVKSTVFSMESSMFAILFCVRYAIIWFRWRFPVIYIDF